MTAVWFISGFPFPKACFTSVASNNHRLTSAAAVRTNDEDFYAHKSLLLFLLAHTRFFITFIILLCLT